MTPSVARLPKWVRVALFDVISSAAAAVLSCTFVFPSSVGEAQRGAVTVGVAVTYAVVAALIRAVPPGLLALRAALGLDDA